MPALDSKLELNEMLPIRLKSYGHHEIGDKNTGLSENPGSGYTKSIVYATAESILKSKVLEPGHQHIVASASDMASLQFDSFEDELGSRYGRSALQLVIEEGLDAYEQIQSHMKANPYLHAALYQKPVSEAAEDLDITPMFVLKKGDEAVQIRSRYKEPQYVVVGGYYEDDYFETDLREFIPELDWVVDNWSDVGGSRQEASRLSPREEQVKKLMDIKTAPEGDVMDCVVYESTGFKIHPIKEVEESVVQDEDDRLVGYCGTRFNNHSSVIRFDIDMGRVDDLQMCGSCKRVIG